VNSDDMLKNETLVFNI